MELVSDSAKGVTTASHVAGKLASELSNVEKSLDKFLEKLNEAVHTMMTASANLQTSFAPPNKVLTETHELVVKYQSNLNYLYQEVSDAIQQAMAEQKEQNELQRRLFNDQIAAVSNDLKTGVAAIKDNQKHKQ
jgi:septal ring factor EnvC (AmiA/AmiB activator)